MARERGRPDDERRRLFRQLEWVFVYAPPILAILVGMMSGAVLAWLFPVAGTSFVGRWSAAAALLVLVPGVAYLVRSWWESR